MAVARRHEQCVWLKEVIRKEDGKRFFFCVALKRGKRQKMIKQIEHRCQINAFRSKKDEPLTGQIAPAQQPRSLPAEKFVPVDDAPAPKPDPVTVAKVTKRLKVRKVEAVRKPKKRSVPAKKQGKVKVKVQRKTRDTSEKASKKVSKKKKVVAKSKPLKKKDKKKTWKKKKRGRKSSTWAGSFYE